MSAEDSGPTPRPERLRLDGQPEGRVWGWLRHWLVGPILIIVMSATGLLLLLACVNVANLLLARGAARAREMAVRAALGATGGRLARQLLTESLVLAILGGVAGLACGYAASWALGSLDLQTDLPLMLDFRFDWRVFAYGLSAALVTGAVVGVAPALRAARGDINAVLHQGGRSVVGSGAREQPPHPGA